MTCKYALHNMKYTESSAQSTGCEFGICKHWLPLTHKNVREVEGQNEEVFWTFTASF